MYIYIHFLKIYNYYLCIHIDIDLCIHILYVQCIIVLFFFLINDFDGRYSIVITYCDNTPIASECVIVLDRSLEVMGARGALYQRYRVAGRQSHATSRCARKISFENHVFGRSSLHNACATRSAHWEM